MGGHGADKELINVGVNGHWYIEIEKQGYWRGNQHTWVNRYIMSGAQPASADASSAVSGLHSIENTLYPAVSAGGGVGFVTGKAYPAGNGPPFFTVTYNAGAAPSTATGFTGPTTAYTNLVFGSTLESCLVVEMKLAGLSSTGKPVYCRKYFRGFSGPPESNGASPIPAGDVSKATAAVAAWRTGVGTNSYVVIGASGAQASASPQALAWLGNRQVPKGRKRKSSSSGSGLISDLSQALQDAGALRNLIGSVPVE